MDWDMISFGPYQRVKEPNIWEKKNWGIDKTIFLF